MIPFYLNVVKLPGAKFEKGRDEDAGYDLYSTENVILYPGCSTIVKVGIKTEFPSGWVGLVRDRSGVGAKGVIHRGGVIDSNYRGEWGVMLTNLSQDTFVIESVINNPKAKAVAQVVFVPYGKCEIQEVQELPESVRGENWKGSTDANNQPKEG